MTVTTAVPRAQRFFDQGLRLLYAFNHEESRRAFKEAARLDPALAMAYWGQALTLAPNLNAPMTPENGRLARQAAVEAVRRRCGCDRPRAGAHRRAGVALRGRPGRATAAARPRLRGCDGQGRRSASSRSRRADALRRRRDEHHAVGLLAEGRHAEAGHRDADEDARSGDRAAPDARRRAPLLHPSARSVADARTRRGQRGPARAR